MSQAFVREGDEQDLSDVSPTLNALIVFLTRENNGIRVYQQKEYELKNEGTVHVMSNGLSYTKNAQGRWKVL
jgi:hypothetical protein